MGLSSELTEWKLDRGHEFMGVNTSNLPNLDKSVNPSSSINHQHEANNEFTTTSDPEKSSIAPA